MRSVIFIACLFVAGCSSSPDPKTQKADQKISAAELCARFAANGARAKEDFSGKVLEIDGAVIGVFPNEVQLMSLSTPHVAAVACYPHSKYTKQLQKVNRGDHITVRGTCRGLMSDEGRNWIPVFDCVILSAD